MKGYVYYNNDFYDENDVNISTQNRSFRYGDGLFETIRSFEGKVPFLAFHLSRLFKGAEVLNMEISYSMNEIQSILNELLIRNEIKNGRIRLMLFRANGGLYLPETNKAELFVEVAGLDQDFFQLNETGKKLGIYTEVPKVGSAISFLKTNNCLAYIQAAIFAKNQSFDTCILLNEKEHLADTIYSNIFMVKEGYVFTPPLSDGGVGGTMRGIILQLLENADFEVFQNSLSVRDIEVADEIFLTNAIKGIQWVGAFGEKEFKNDFSNDLIQRLNQLVKESISR